MPPTQSQSAFQWTDELVIEYTQQWSRDRKIPSVAIEFFKQSKVKKEEPKQWEILCFESSLGKFCKLRENGLYSYDTHGGWELEVMLSDKSNKIKTVERISDNEVITVNKTHVMDNNTGHDWIVSELTVKDDRCFANGVNILEAHLRIIPPPPEEPLPIKVESIAFYTSMGTKPIRDVFSVKLTGDISEDKLQAIKKAIQSVINNDGLSEYFNKLPKLYTSDELLEAQQKAFYAARESKVPFEAEVFSFKLKDKYPTFAHYIENQSLNK